MYNYPTRVFIICFYHIQTKPHDTIKNMKVKMDCFTLQNAAYMMTGVLVVCLVWHYTRPYLSYLYRNILTTSESFSKEDVRGSFSRKPTYWWKGNKTHRVTISDNRFSPQYITVYRGDTVTWTNMDDKKHTIHSHTGLFRSNVLDKQQKHTFSHTFDSSGVFDYLLADMPQRIGGIRVIT